MTPPAATQAAARLWTALVMWASQLAKLMLAMHAVSHKPPAGSVSAVHVRACTGINRNRSKSDPCSYELFCLESLILSFSKVMQIPPESPCMYISKFKLFRYNFYSVVWVYSYVGICKYERVEMLVAIRFDFDWSNVWTNKCERIGN